MRAFREVGAKLHLAGTIGITAYVIASLAVASVLAICVNAWFEKPATRTARLVLRVA
jgi:hypothetical protein